MEKEKVWNFIVDYLFKHASGVGDKSDVVDLASLKDDLIMDSLDFVEFIMAIEREFGISIPDEEAANFETVKDVREYLENH